MFQQENKAFTCHYQGFLMLPDWLYTGVFYILMVFSVVLGADTLMLITAASGNITTEQ